MLCTIYAYHNQQRLGKLHDKSNYFTQIEMCAKNIVHENVEIIFS